jgi:hypothetical protein
LQLFSDLVLDGGLLCEVHIWVIGSRAWVFRVVLIDFFVLLVVCGFSDCKFRGGFREDNAVDVVGWSWGGGDFRGTALGAGEIGE